jgi:hypothetical protein
MDECIRIQLSWAKFRHGTLLETPACMIRKLASGEYRIYSRKKNEKTGKRRNLGTFKTRQAAEKHEKRDPVFQVSQEVAFVA